MKELYIRKGNSLDTKDIIIIGEEQSLGGRDLNGYKPGKGSSFIPIIKKDPYSNNTGLTYIHATPNISLDTSSYSRDYDVHRFVKEYCNDLVKWDGEANEGRVRSREAFIVKENISTQKVCEELYKRINQEIHGFIPHNIHIFWKKFFKVIKLVFSIPFKILWFILKNILKKRHIKKFIKNIIFGICLFVIFIFLIDAKFGKNYFSQILDLFKH